MEDKKIKTYDLICSLGGNCAGAHNLLIRNLRPFSLPFDWTFIRDEEAVKNLANGFKTKFVDLLKKSNLQEIAKDNIIKGHEDRVQYEDTGYKIYFPNHFSKDIYEFPQEFNDVYLKIKRRIKRLFCKIEQSKNILFILTTNIKLSPESLLYLSNTLSELYPQRDIDIRIMLFNQDNEETLEQKIKNVNLIINKYKRNTNIYDFTHTNIEWAFLDNIKIKEHSKFIKISLAKRSLKISIFNFIRSILYLKFYILGLRIFIYIGREKEN